MKYNILIKYINSIPSATEENKIDTARIQLLCEKLGRVNVGGGYIYLSGGEYAHGGGVILESILKSSGYSVARITDAYGFDIKRSIYLDGTSPSIEEFTNILTYIRDILKKHNDISFLREEVVFAFCLYVSKILGVKYVILENTCESTRSMFEICAPYNFAIIPKLYGEVDDTQLSRVSSCIDKVNRGVVTGNNHLYNYFSGCCHKAGIRLSIHRSVDIIEEKMRQQTFVYNKREYVLKSSSAVLRDCAISSIELIDMMKNHGAKIPPAAICDGIKNVGNCGFFEVVSLSPMIICDNSSGFGQLELLCQKLSEYSKKSNLDGVAVCTEPSSDAICKAFSKLECVSYIDSAGVSVNELADKILDKQNMSKLTVILGGLEFCENVKSAVKSKMDKF